MATNRSTILTQALVAAVIGFLTIIVIFVFSDFIAGRPVLHTPSVLGAALFGGGGEPVTEPSARFALAYTGVHFVAFLLFGLLAALLARVADRGWQLWYPAAFFMIFVGFHLFAVVQGLAAPARAAISQTMIWVAGLIASALMAFYLLQVHPRVRGQQQW
jgi:predicted tellurium resistance membrane protein TerC